MFATILLQRGRRGGAGQFQVSVIDLVVKQLLSQIQQHRRQQVEKSKKKKKKKKKVYILYSLQSMHYKTRNLYASLLNLELASLSFLVAVITGRIDLYAKEDIYCLLLLKSIVQQLCYKLFVQISSVINKVLLSKLIYCQYNLASLEIIPKVNNAAKILHKLRYQVPNSRSRCLV